MEFQFTHPGGVRHRALSIASLDITCFNSRTREGCDQKAQTAMATMSAVSIHAPGRGATGSPLGV